MRRKHLTVLFAFPMADALSLANFQEITSILIPLSCQLTYDGQIPSCTKSDFNKGCTTACIAGLNSIAQSVSDSCAEVTVNSNTLLGIVKNGGIVAALCPTLAKTTSTIPQLTTPIAVSSAAPAVSVTIPTDSQGVTGGLGLKTTSTTATSIPTPQSILTTSSSHRSSSVVSVTIKSTSTTTTSTSSTSVSSVSSTSSTSSVAGGIGGSTPPITTSSTSSSKKGSVAATTTATTSKPAAQPDDGGSGGGSPFDIQSSGSRIGGDSILGLVILMMVCILMGR